MFSIICITVPLNGNNCMLACVCFRMTGVGGRPEVIIEGSNDPAGENWKVLSTLVV